MPEYKCICRGLFPWTCFNCNYSPKKNIHTTSLTLWGEITIGQVISVAFCSVCVCVCVCVCVTCTHGCTFSACPVYRAPLTAHLFKCLGRGLAAQCLPPPPAAAAAAAAAAAEIMLLILFYRQQPSLLCRVQNVLFCELSLNFSNPLCLRNYTDTEEKTQGR